MPAPIGYSSSSQAIDSDDEASNASATVILAFSDGPINEVTDATTSKLGGAPRFWPAASKAPALAVSHCRLCGEAMPLVAQIYCPLEEIHEDRHRAIYVWSCRRKACRSSQQRFDQRLADDWTRQRAEEQAERDRQEAERNKAAAPVNPFASTFANPFASASSAGGLGDAIFGSASSVSSPVVEAPKAPIVSPPQVAPKDAEWDADALVKLPALYLATAYEPTSDSSSLSSDIDNLSLGSDGREGRHRAGKGKGRRKEDESSSEDGGWAGETFEVQRLPGMSIEFERFQQRVTRPGAEGQCVRYERGGSPLRYGSSRLAAVPNCEACGSTRTFELQIMPQVVTLLDKDTSDDLELGWATVHVYTCARDCVEADGRGEIWREEPVQLELED